MHNGKPWNKLTNTEKKEIKNFRDFEKAQTKEINKDFKDFANGFNSGEISLEININIVVTSAPITPKFRKRQKSESLTSVKNSYLMSMRKSYCICALCGQKITRAKDLTIDHKTPVIHGGGDEESNLQPAHYRCNKNRGANPIKEKSSVLSDKNIEIKDIEFKDDYRQKHFVSIAKDLGTGHTTIHTVVISKYKKKTENFIEYDSRGKIVNSMIAYTKKGDKYYNFQKIR